MRINILRYSWAAILSLSLLSLPSYGTENQISAGTEIKVRMAEPVDSRLRKAGYQFKVTVDSDIKNGDKVVIKSGSKAQAIINKIERPGKGQQTPRLIVTLTSIIINNRQIKVESFPLAGKGTSNIRKQLGEIDENENIVIGEDGEKIDASIPVLTKGYDLTLSEGTVLYFILKTAISL